KGGDIFSLGKHPEGDNGPQQPHGTWGTCWNRPAVWPMVEGHAARPQQEPPPMPPQQIWTVGHSNRELAEFLDMLSAHDIQLVADVRRFPGSRRQPQFSAET